MLPAVTKNTKAIPQTGIAALYSIVTNTEALNAISLPDSFPKLAAGATTHSKNDNSKFSMDWNFQSEDKAKEMAAKLQK